MKFSFRKLLAFVLPLAMVMVSCNDDDPTYSNPYLTVGNRNISFTKEELLKMNKQLNRIRRAKK